MSKDKKIKVCLISFLAYPLFNPDCDAVFGGAEIDLYNLANKLAEDDSLQITFVTGDYGQKPQMTYGKVRTLRFKYMNLDTYNGIIYKTLRHIAMWIGLLKLDSDILITETSSDVLGWMALISKKLKRKKIIFRLAHDLDTDLVGVRANGYKSYLLYKLGILNADVIISQTDIQKKLLMKNLKLDSTVIKNGFDISSDVDYKSKSYILWVARAQDWKRPELFTEIARRMPEQEFLMIMPGDNEIKSQIRERIEGLNNLKLIDSVPFSEVQKYYDHARLFVNTSIHEGFPNAFVQACLAGTPILSFNVNPDGFIGKYDLGMMCDNSMDEAVAFIKGLSDEKMVEYGEHARRYVQENHDIGSISDVYKEIIYKLFKGH